MIFAIYTGLQLHVVFLAPTEHTGRCLMDDVSSFLCFFVCGEKLCKSFASLFRFRIKVTNLEFVKSCCGKLRCGHAVVTSVVRCGQYHQLSIKLASAQHWTVLAMSEDDRR